MHGEDIHTADGRLVHAQIGDYRIVRDTLTLDVVPPGQFTYAYEEIPQGALLLGVRDCNALDEVLGLGATQNADRLVAAVNRLASIKVGDIRIPFTPGQLAELQHRAQKRGRTLEAEMKAVVARIEDELFYKGG